VQARAVFTAAGRPSTPRKPPSPARWAPNLTLIAAFPVLAAQGLTDQQLVVTHPIEVSGVQQGDTGVEGGVDSGDAFALVSRTVGSRHSTAAGPMAET